MPTVSTSSGTSGITSVAEACGRLKLSSLCTSVRAPARADDLRQGLSFRAVAVEALLCQRCKTQHGADDVVEVMRDATGQRAHGLDLLRLTRKRLGAAP